MAKAKARQSQETLEWEADIEKRIQDVITFTSKLDAPKLSKIAREFCIPYARFYARHTQLRKTRAKRDEDCQLLSNIQEEVLVDWAKLWGREGQGINRETLRIKAKHICGHKPSLRWVTDFRRRHPDVAIYITSA
ncbi:hypothetical protein BV20DRAFT_983911 [Pilatotrama ljubarskyi]|nr:hypothetical protein BV20DRAFT_983911 [Pilatotrama ljubarskyi]